MSDYNAQTSSNIGYGYDEPFPIKNIPYYGFSDNYPRQPQEPSNMVWNEPIYPNQPPSNQPQNYIPIDKSTKPSFRTEYLLLGGAFIGLFIRAIMRR